MKADVHAIHKIWSTCATAAGGGEGGGRELKGFELKRDRTHRVTQIPASSDQ